RDSAELFFNIFYKFSSENVDEYAYYLPDLVDAINALESNKNETKNAELVTQITNALIGEDRDDEAIKDMLAELAVLEVADVLEMPMLDKPKAYKPARSIGDESIFGKLDEIKAAVLEAAAAPAADSAPTEAKPEEAYQAQSEQPEKTEEEQDLDYGAVTEILAAVDELKAALGANENADISQVLEEVRNNYVELANKLVQIFEAIQTPPMVTSDGDEVRYIPTMTEEEKHHAIDDLIYIREKMDEQGELVTRLDEIQNAILGIGGNSDVPASLTDSINALLGDINTQFDKLYEDLSNALIESESNIIARFSEFGNPAESVENARLDIIADNQTTRDAVMSLSDAVLADTQAIRESLLAASDASLTATVNDAIEQLRADVAALTAQTAQNTDAATLDRQKLLDDVTFLREQAELAIAESEQAAGEDVDRHAEQEEAVNAYLDDISSRVALLATVPDDVATVRDAIISVSDNVNAVLDNVTLLGDTVQPIAEDVAATRDTANAVLEALAPISEQLTSILERFDAAAEEQPLYEEQEVVQENVAEEALSGQELAELKESVNNILDTLTLLPQAEDVVAARDNTYSIIETLTAMPHAEDVNVTRDNVASVLAAVTSLSENMEAVLASTNASAQVADGLTAMTETVNTTAEDVNYIRTKLDEQQAGENLSQIMQDIGTVLDKIEEFSLAAANNKQEIIDTVNGIREEVHISTLDETMTAAGIDDETRDVLIGEIADMRERLAGIESATQSMSELNTTTLDGINGQLADLQALLEERLSGEAVEQAESGENASDALKVVLDEIATLKEKLDVQTEFDTVEEILSLREDIKASRIVDQDEVSGELEAIKNELAAISSGNILDEIRALREDLVNMPSGEGAAEPTGGELNLVLNEIVSLRDEVFSFKDEVLGGGVAAEPQGEQSEPQSGDDVNAILDELSALRIDQSALTDNIDELKDLISRRTSLGVAETDGEEQQAAPSAGELNVVLDEIINLKNDIERIEASLGDDNLYALRTEISELKAAVGEMSPAGDYATELDTLRAEVQALREENEQLRMAGTSDISAQLAEIKEAMQGMALSGAPAAPADDTMYAALIEEIRGLKEAFAANAEPAQQSFDLGDELLEIRDEIAQLRSLTTVTAESGGAAEVAAMRDELAELKNMLSQSDSLYAVAEDVTAIKADVQSLKDEPDLGVMSEILALRDEFQALREQIEEVKRVAGQTNKAADDSLMNEVQSLRDQLFAISMANVNDPASGESNYESYNNIILDEIASLRDQVNAVSNGADQEAMAEEFASLREAIDRRDAAYDELAELVGSMNNAAENSKILDEIASLRNEVANQRDADMSTLNFMSEMAHLIERQNQYLTKNAGTDIADKIESLKAELASSDAIAQEVAKLRKIMEQAGSSSDNDTILNELAELREELSAAKPSRENEIILDAIARLRNEVTMLAERDNAPAINTTDTDLSDSLS
ncbi:MAG: hypothetical protein J1G04_06715, partial [Clostridiales bacterium]|nr:hypothetical protein [Clostridiales bacterium]